MKPQHLGDSGISQAAINLALAEVKLG